LLKLLFYSAYHTVAIEALAITDVLLTAIDIFAPGGATALYWVKSN
jgi:hypothetical protein